MEVKVVNTNELHVAGSEIVKQGYPVVIFMRWKMYESLKLPEHKVTMADGDLPGLGAYVYLKPEHAWVQTLITEAKKSRLKTIERSF